MELVLISLAEKEPFAMESLEEIIYPPQASSEASEQEKTLTKGEAGQIEKPFSLSKFSNQK